MGAQTRQQIFPYSFKTVSVADRAAVSFTSFNGNATYGNLIGLEIINPVDFYSCQGLSVHLRFTDSTTARTIRQVIVADSTSSATWNRSIQLNSAASGLTNDVVLDLTSIRNVTGTNIVLFDFTTAISGTIKIFKLDMLYEVVGIR